MTTFVRKIQSLTIEAIRSKPMVERIEVRNRRIITSIICSVVFTVLAVVISFFSAKGIVHVISTEINLPAAGYDYLNGDRIIFFEVLGEHKKNFARIYGKWSDFKENLVEDQKLGYFPKLDEKKFNEIMTKGKYNSFPIKTRKSED